MHKPIIRSESSGLYFNFVSVISVHSVVRIGAILYKIKNGMIK
jgi:hypothetical protein